MGHAAGIYVRQMTSILLHRNDEILLLHREGSRVIEDSWVGIGGHVEDAESSRPRLAALRELHEEIGLREEQLSDLRLRYVALREVPDELRTTYYFTAHVDRDTPIPAACREGTLRWFSVDADLSGLRMPPTARIVLDHWLHVGRFDATTRYITLTASGETSMTDRVG